MRWNTLISLTFQHVTAEREMMRKIVCAVTLSVLFGTIIAAQQPATTSAPDQKKACECAEIEAKLKSAGGWQKVAEDWPNLGRYREANSKVPPLQKDEQRVVFMGDSITDIWGSNKYGPFFPDKPYINRGIGGQTTPQMLIRFRPDVIDLHPKVVVILAGTNDIAGNTGPMTLEETEENLASMAELARQHDIRVVLSSVTPVVDGIVNAEGKKLVFTDGRPPEKIVALNQWIKQYCEQYGHIYLDYYSAMVDDKGFLRTNLTFDGLHPNAEGYVIMAPLAEKAIEAALKEHRP
jgi:lysophospholipase L1-like esterase